MFDFAFTYVTINPGRGSSGGLDATLPILKRLEAALRTGEEINFTLEERQQAENEIIFLLAGLESAQHFDSRYSLLEAKNDLRKADCIAVHLGRNRHIFSDPVKDFVSSTNDWKKIEAVAQALLEHENLCYQRVKEICENV